MFKPITHLIYDMDGLLLDTESFHEQVNREIAQRYGKSFDPSIKLKIAGRPTLDSARILVELLELPLTPETFLEERKQLLYPLYPQAQPLPGAIFLTKHFYQRHIPQAIATSSSSHHFQLKTINHQEWIKLFDCIVLGDDPAITKGKPEPDIFLLTAQRLQAHPEKCLVFEDSPAGVQAAKQAGMSVVAIPHSDFDEVQAGAEPEPLAPHPAKGQRRVSEGSRRITLELGLYQDADQILNSLTEFQPQLWHLPQ
jgi:pseudouridine-5'-monophosphatase